MKSRHQWYLFIDNNDGDLICVQSINITGLFAYLYLDCSLVVGKDYNNVLFYAFFAVNKKSSLRDKKRNYQQ